MNIMKIYNKKINKNLIAFVMLGVIAITGCEKRLDIAPYQSIDVDKALLTEGDVLGTLSGSYDGAQAATTYGGDIMVMNELLGNSVNIRFTGTFAGLSEVAKAQLTTTNSNASGTWAQAYGTINRCNNVLSALDKVISSTDKKNSVEGQALFLRASMYFELVKLYAKAVGDGDYATNPGVPLILKPTAIISKTDYAARATVKAVYDQVIVDLLKAESLLPASNSFYANKYAAAAQLSRVYLALKNYTEAGAAANRVITGSGKILNPDFSKLWFTYINSFGATPSEYIFFMKMTQTDGTNALNTYFGRLTSAIPGTGGRGDCRINAAHIALYETGDIRKTFFQVISGSTYTKKHLDLYGDVPVIRLAEMYLTRAEANQRNTTVVGASPLSDVNAIRTRAGLPALTAVTLAAILKERMLELAFEGQFLPDAKRTQTAVGALAWNSPKLILPIPQREMDVNKQLVQNEGY